MLRLPERHHDQRRQHRPHRRAKAAAELEHRLRKTVATAGGEPRDARGIQDETPPSRGRPARPRSG